MILVLTHPDYLMEKDHIKYYEELLDYLDEVTDDASFPYVNANVRDVATGKLAYNPYVLIEKEVVDSNTNDPRDQLIFPCL